MTYIYVQDAVFAALADPTRRKVLERLRAGPMAVGDVAKDLPVSRPAVSQHLKALTEAGLTEARAVGTRRYYSVRPQGLEALRLWLDAFWEAPLASFKQHMETKDDPFGGQDNSGGGRP